MLVEALIKELTRRGYSVATIKSTNEDASDVKGTDTARHRMAGAKTTILVGPKTLTLRSERPSSLREILSSVQSDIMLIEGMKEKDIPKIWCIGNNELPKTLPDGVVAVYTWDKTAANRKEQTFSVYTMEQISELADLVETASVDLMEMDL